MSLSHTVILNFCSRRNSQFKNNIRILVYKKYPSPYPPANVLRDEERGRTLRRRWTFHIPPDKMEWADPTPRYRSSASESRCPDEWGGLHSRATVTDGAVTLQLGHFRPGCPEISSLCLVVKRGGPHSLRPLDAQNYLQCSQRN
ncbi:hypothetical protein CEXT_354911 [Caerostris extrusa]|uniref:Uncharacterized protein n=1 Tax=Caerostris extrusa TaxID=172846 RepID=A0AAV4UQI8_CAEEX|nr:hypothetical protein CEXT_354911 [Caerostris extrusa]